MNSESSIKIKVYRASTFLSRIQDKSVDDYMSMAKMSIGSYFESRTSRRVGTGKLTQIEFDLLLPRFVEVDAKHPEFMKKVTEYYHEMDTKIPYGMGLELEIGLLDNTKKIGDILDKQGTINLPLEAGDYIRYRHLKDHPDVARNKEEADSNPQKKYYIFDPEELKRITKLKNETKDIASQKFLELKQNKTKVRMALALMGENLKVFTGRDRDITMEEKLRQLVAERPADFIAVIGTKDTETRFFIQELVNNKIINCYNGKYTDPEAPSASKSLLANDIDEFITYLTMDSNSAMVVSLKARLEEKSIDYQISE